MCIKLSEVIRMYWFFVASDSVTDLFNIHLLTCYYRSAIITRSGNLRVKSSWSLYSGEEDNEYREWIMYQIIFCVPDN